MKAPSTPILKSFLICVHGDVSTFHQNGVHIASHETGKPVELNPSAPMAAEILAEFQGRLNITEQITHPSQLAQSVRVADDSPAYRTLALQLRASLVDLLCFGDESMLMEVEHITNLDNPLSRLAKAVKLLKQTADLKSDTVTVLKSGVTIPDSVIAHLPVLKMLILCRVKSGWMFFDAPYSFATGEPNGETPQAAFDAYAQAIEGK